MKLFKIFPPLFKGFYVDNPQNRKLGRVGMPYQKKKNPKDFEKIPIESNLDLENLEKYDGTKFNHFKYFGDCKSTVDKDHIWDTQQMSNWIYNHCKVIDTNEVIDKIENGDNKIPIKLKKSIENLKKKDKLNDKSEIVCALDDYQEIMFIYITNLDIHFFFDCKK